MADGPRLTTQLVDLIEVVMDTYKEHMADGTTTATEHREMSAVMDELYQLALYADESFGLAVTMARRGYQSPSVRRRMTEHGLRVLKGGKGEGPRAA